MKRIALIIIVVALLPIVAVLAQAAMSSWAFVAEVTPQGTAAGVFALSLPNQIMDKSRDDLADLRLFDAKGSEIPYALQIRREVADQREVSGRLFNQVNVGSTASEASVDLGENPGEHNEVEIETGGTNFRRRVDVEGSDSGKDWKTLAGDGIFDFESQNKAVRSSRISYPTSRYRYLRVRVFADEVKDKAVPVITSVRVSMALRAQGKLTSWSVAVPPAQLLRNQGAPASAWTIDLGGRVPCDRLTLDIDAESFSRPFQIEAIDDPQNIRLVASGELTRRIGEEPAPLVVIFEHEEHLRKLRLLVTDYSNQTLPISGIIASAPARQLFFEIKEPSSLPLRLFFGNAKAIQPHYDFERDFSAQLSATPIEGDPSSLAHGGWPGGSEIGVFAPNPGYKPDPLPLTERVPWLIYVVLTASSVALALILISLARATLRTKPQPTEEVGSEIRTG